VESTSSSLSVRRQREGDSSDLSEKLEGKKQAGLAPSSTLTEEKGKRGLIRGKRRSCLPLEGKEGVASSRGRGRVTCML